MAGSEFRPPESSFCWLPSDQVELDSNGTTGRIIDPEAVAWIGTNLGRARKYRWQIQFQKNEPVTVIGYMDRESANGEKDLWYRIVPPPGEFRWIHQSQVVTSREELALIEGSRRSIARATNDNQGDSEASLAAATDLSGQAPAPFDARAARQAAAQGRGILNDGGEIAQVAHEKVIGTRPIRSRFHLADEIRVRDLQSSYDQQSQLRVESDSQQTNQPSPWTQAIRSAATDRISQPQDLQASATIPRGSSESFSIDLRRLQLDLARLMASQGSFQQTESLRIRAQRLAGSVDDPADQSQVRSLLDRIAKFQQIASQRSSTEFGTARAEMTSDTPEETAARTGSFDQQGWLVKVYSARPDAPPYALTDQDGKMIAYVSPAMGLTPRRLLNQQVGIVGKRVTNSSTDESPHFLARKIIPLNR